MDEKFIAAMVALLAAVFAAIANLYWNFHSARASRRLSFLNKQLEYCFEVSEIAGKLATTSDETEWDAAQERFFELFWGPLAIVEDDDVARAMMKFSFTLGEVDAKSLPAQTLHGPSLDLGAQIRKLLLKSWNISDLALVLEDRHR